MSKLRNERVDRSNRTPIENRIRIKNGLPSGGKIPTHAYREIGLIVDVIQTSNGTFVTSRKISNLGANKKNRKFNNRKNSPGRPHYFIDGKRHKM